MAHPLSGANIGTLAAVVRRAGLPDKPLAGAGIALSVLGRWPFSAAERILMESRLPAAEDVAPPVFILGHWRSGTTHLYNTMTQSGDWAYVPPVATGLPWDLFGLAKAFRPLLERALPEHRFIDNIPVKPDSPQEDEIAVANMSDLSFYHGIYFPRAFREFVYRGLFFDDCGPEEVEGWRRMFLYLMRKLSHYQGRKPLLIKNPTYTARLAMLLEMFPEAKFIHIHRNPYEVFVSMRNFWSKLLKEFALQDYAHVDIDETILDVYERMMRKIETESAGLPADRFIELRYSELDQNPMAALEEVYSTLNLPGFDLARPAFAAYLASVRSFKKNKFDYSDEAAEKVSRRLGYFLDKWGYARPGGEQGQARGELRHDEDAGAA
ncbi:MAG: sulfotransferase [Alphaproteobacteria bacterium]|nr:sulfotransferase [Alphaproteobacteria bacterium]